MPKKSRITLPRAEYKLLCSLVHQRDGWKCRHCKSRNNLHAHHVIFRSQGGDDADWNMITLCNECHDAIHKRYLVILAPSGDEFERVNANGKVKFMRIDGWYPGRGH